MNLQKFRQVPMTFNDITNYSNTLQFLMQLTHLNKPHYMDKLKYVNKINYEGAMQANELQSFDQKRIPVHKWRVVCDSMLGGWYSKLRMYRCDYTHILFNQNGDRFVKLAIRENRTFLTRNKEYLKFFQYLPPKKRYLVVSNTPDKQLQEVLNQFTVLIIQKDIFSRCQIYNSDKFVKVTKSFMEKLMQSFVQVTCKNNYRVPSNSLEHPANDKNYFKFLATSTNEIFHCSRVNYSKCDIMFKSYSNDEIYESKLSSVI